MEKKWIPKDITGSEGLVLRNLLKKLLMIYQEMADNQEIADVKCQSTNWLKIACHVQYQEIADNQEIADVKCQSTKGLKIACHVVYQEIADVLAIKSR